MTYIPDSAVKFIFVHYSATYDDQVVTAADIERMHLKRGFNKIGYHAFIRRTGTVEPGRDMTRPGKVEQGAQVSGHNHHSVGVCFAGGLKRGHGVNKGFDTRTPEQTEALIAWIDAQLARFGGDGMDPAKGPLVVGHRDAKGAATQCPGFDVAPWWAEVQANRRAAKRPRIGLLAAIVNLLKGARA
ncbi:N-acetylmuramoyl-L-alanine amidase [Mangrovicoccus algicola]|uniref:N-acetylmuramoyl-L-alanine amidase n=1 Tax=Mangrovicoccus algicola TaxID=2771008 RepID=A0A8J7CUD9_9RHOB|nr:N-acetylmuramoyl-L-alanine amidase [Mangrovicoccus algicola]MBE3637364.1 N-acetylmuramoyl-L-alanine amidase [Mangrovicoccus algicola]